MNCKEEKHDNEQSFDSLCKSFRDKGCMCLDCAFKRDYPLNSQQSVRAPFNPGKMLNNRLSSAKNDTALKLKV